MRKGIIVKETINNRNNGNIGNEGPIKGEPTGGDCGEEKQVRTVNSIKVEDAVKAEPERAEYDDRKEIKRLSSANSEEAIECVNTSTEIKVENGDAVKAAGKSYYSSGHVKVESEKKEENLYSDHSKKSAPISPPKLSSVPYTKDKNRDKIRELLAEALCKVAGEVYKVAAGEVYKDLREEVDACDPFRVATEVESAMFAKWGLFNGAQKVKYRSIMFNIKDPNNPDFRRKVLLGQYPTAKSITDLTRDEMESDERQKENEKIKEKALLECERRAPPWASTNEFRCNRCKKNEFTYFQLQLTPDEPMTTYLTCMNCGSRCKFC